jgi:hypothetical protein
MPIETRLRVGAVYSLASFQWRDHCWDAATGTIDGSCASSLFVVRQGKAGGETISLESVASPGHFWRHRNGSLHVDKDDGSDLFRRDASWMALAGL